jgi:hypothetical protein
VRRAAISRGLNIWTLRGLLFYEDPPGDFIALDERIGKPQWHFAAGSENKTSLITYMVGGKQYVAIAIGPNILCFGLPAGREKKASEEDQNEFQYDRKLESLFHCEGPAERDLGKV